MPIIENIKKQYWSIISKKKQYLALLSEKVRAPVLKNSGYCPTCAQQVTFIAQDAWLRDHYRCSNCGSIPRERALMQTIESYYPNCPDLIIHESSPVNRGASKRLSQECSQ